MCWVLGEVRVRRTGHTVVVVGQSGNGGSIERRTLLVKMLTLPWSGSSEVVFVG